MRTAFATVVAAAALLAAGGQALAAPSAPASLPPPPPLAIPKAAAPQPLTFEGKAGCGVILVAMDVAIRKYPKMFGEGEKDDQKAMMQFMMQVMGRQGSLYLDEAFAEGAKRGLSPAQVYSAGVEDLLANFQTDPRDEDAGDEMVGKFLGRCLSIEPSAGL